MRRLYVKSPLGHPRRRKDGTITRANSVAEKQLCRFLLPDEVVHHINGNTEDIAFKAGQAFDIEIIRDTYNKAYEKGKKAGEKKVAEWIKTHQMPDNPSSEPYPGLVLISKSQLEEFLKSEGIG